MQVLLDPSLQLFVIPHRKWVNGVNNLLLLSNYHYKMCDLEAIKLEVTNKIKKSPEHIVTKVVLASACSALTYSKSVRCAISRTPKRQRPGTRGHFACVHSGVYIVRHLCLYCGDQSCPTAVRLRRSSLHLLTQVGLRKHTAL